jgi:hypothetical protein
MTWGNLYRCYFLLFGAGIILLLNGCTQTSFTYGAAGSPAVTTNGRFLIVLVAESESTTRQENGGYRSSSYNSSYWLKQYETTTGNLIRKKKIITGAEKMNLLPLCYGGYADKIWLHTSELVAYDINTLEEVANEEKLAKQNNFDVNNFPTDPRFFHEKVADGYIRFTAIDGEKYRLDLSTLKITGEDKIAKNNTTPQYELLHKIIYGVRNDTMNGKMYILAKDSATAMNSHPDNSDNEAIYKRLYLFTASYTTSKISNHIFYRYSDLKKFSGSSYLNGIFLKDFKTNKIAKLQKPGAYIILHNDSLSNAAQSILTAIDENNHVIWEINTGLSTKLANCIVKNNYCVITGNKHYLLAPHTGSDMICIVNLETGKMATPSVAD